MTEGTPNQVLREYRHLDQALAKRQFHITRGESTCSGH
jgi:hypothetical protein